MNLKTSTVEEYQILQTEQKCRALSPKIQPLNLLF